MATVTKPIALDESFNTTEATPRNIADVLAEELSRITGRNASQVEYDNTESGLDADNVQDALDEIVEDIPTVPSVDIQTAVDEFETYNGGLLSSLKVSLTPNQDLHGYDEPWVGGAGKNSFVSATAKTEEQNNVKIWTDGDGIYHINGTPTATTNILFPLKQGFTIPPSSTHHFYLGNDFNNVNVTLSLMNGSTQVDNWTCTPVNRDSDSYSAMANKYIDGVRVIVQSGVSLSNVSIAPMLLLDTETDTSYASWDNICPISGHTEVDIDVSDGQATQEQVTVNLGGTYYSGTLDVVTGVFTPDTASDDLGSLTWQTRYTGSVNKTLSSSLSQKPLWAETAGEVQCEDYKYNGKVGGASILSDPDNCEVGLYLYYVPTQEGNAKVCYLVIPVDNSPNDKVVYELNDTTPIQLIPTPVKANVGENHLSAPLEGQEITESKYKQMFTFDDVIAYIQSLS